MDDQNVSGPSSERVVDLAGAILDGDAMHDLLHRLMLLARHTVEGAQSVSITVLEDGAYRTANSTGPDALAIDEAQYEQNDGPCLEAMRSARQLQITVGEQASRWPRFEAAARDVGVAGVLSTPLVTAAGDAIGALNIYAVEPPPYAPANLGTAVLLGENATILVGRALALASSHQLADQLRQAVATREVIGMAKGILMQTQAVTRDEAFDILRRASQRENRKLRDVAEELVARVESRAGSEDGQA